MIHTEWRGVVAAGTQLILKPAMYEAHLHRITEEYQCLVKGQERWPIRDSLDELVEHQLTLRREVRLQEGRLIVVRCRGTRDVQIDLCPRLRMARPIQMVCTSISQM